MTSNVLAAYKNYFGFEARFVDESWTPKSVCAACFTKLTEFNKGKPRFFTFGKPVEWRSPVDHDTDCYFCLTKLQGGKYAKAVYPDVQSVTKTVPHCSQYPKPQPPIPTTTSFELVEASTSECSIVSNTGPKLMKQSRLNDICRDLNLSKDQSQLLASRLQEDKFLDPSTRVTYYRTRSKPFEQYFSTAEDFCYCNDVNALFTAFGENHNPGEWRLFIDGNKYSVKAVLLHKGNKKPSIPVGHSTNVKETYQTMKKLFALIDYNSYKWKICCDLKVVALVTGLQGGYTKYSCFLCLWDSRADELHFTQREWPRRETSHLKKHNIVEVPLVSKEDVIIPPLHVKLGLMKNFVKALAKDPDNKGLKYLRTKFPKLSTDKIKAGIFDGPQIRTLLKDPELLKQFNNSEKDAWNAFAAVIHGFLGNKREPNARELVDHMLHKFQLIGRFYLNILYTQNLTLNLFSLGARMSLKMHFLYSHFDAFPINLGAESDEQGERFHKDIAAMEKRYEGFWDQRMMGDYCWMQIREDNTQHKRKISREKSFFMPSM